MKLNLRGAGDMRGREAANAQPRRRHGGREQPSTHQSYVTSEERPLAGRSSGSRLSTGPWQADRTVTGQQQKAGMEIVLVVDHFNNSPFPPLRKPFVFFSFSGAGAPVHWTSPLL